MYPQAQAVFRERYGEMLEPEFMAICEQLREASAVWFERDEPPQCLVHGDFRLVGRPMTDVGYFIGCGIGAALWRDHERELLDLWRAEMRVRGIDLTHEEIERDYRLGILHGISTSVFSAAFVERTERGDANFLSMARGACSLALERDSIQILKEAT